MITAAEASRRSQEMAQLKEKTRTVLEQGAIDEAVNYALTDISAKIESECMVGVSRLIYPLVITASLHPATLNSISASVLRALRNSGYVVKQTNHTTLDISWEKL